MLGTLLYRTIEAQRSAVPAFFGLVGPRALPSDRGMCGLARGALTCVPNLRVEPARRTAESGAACRHARHRVSRRALLVRADSTQRVRCALLVRNARAVGLDIGQMALANTMEHEAVGNQTVQVDVTKIALSRVRITDDDRSQSLAPQLGPGVE